MSTISVVAAAAGGVESLRTGLVQPLVESGHRVAVTLTPTAATWLDALGEVARLATLTGLPVRSAPRLPGEPRPHPQADLCVGAPLSANSTAKLALGIGDNQALTVLSESVGAVPLIVFPSVNAAHARHPAWDDHLSRLRAARVQVIYGDDVWPLTEPRSTEYVAPPWRAILRAVECVAPQ